MSLKNKFIFFTIACLSFVLINTVLYAADNTNTEQAGGVIIDVRTPEEYNSGHVDGALNINYTDIGSRIESVVPDKNATIQLYCGSGRRAGIAKETLENMGYRNVVNEGGFKEFQERMDSKKQPD